MKSAHRTIATAVSMYFLIALHSISAFAGAKSYDINLLLDNPHPFAVGTERPTTAGPNRQGPSRPSGPNRNAPVKTGNGLAGVKNEGLTKEQKVLLLNSAAVASIATYGAIQWNYFQTSWKATSEGWFGRTTKSGGADKLGHLWSTYAASHLLSHIYGKWGYSDSAANGLGALSALGIQTIMELGDGFSGDFGFSYEDMIMNIAGAGAGYVLGRYPALKSKIDLRVEYTPDSIGDLTGDIFTNYENQRYLVALKLDGFDTFHESPLGYFELHAGYLTRGYDTYPSGGSDNRERSMYFGIGLNVRKLVRELTNTDLAVFDYVQVPYTSLRTSVGLD